MIKNNKIVKEKTKSYKQENTNKYKSGLKVSKIYIERVIYIKE